MAAGGKNIEVKVGALILVSLVLLGGFIVIMGGLSVAKVYHLYVDFDNPMGLQAGAPVRIAGVKVGKVENLEFRGGKVDPQVKWRALVRVKISVEEKVRDSVHDDATFVITTQGVLGEPFIAINPGTAENPVLPPNSIRLGKDPPRLDVFLAEASDLIHAAHEAITKGDGPLSQLAKHGASLIKGLDMLLIENRDSITKTVKNTEKVTASAIELVDATKATIDGPQVKRILDNVDRTTATIANQTPVIMRDVRAAVTDVRGALAKVDTIGNNVTELTKNANTVITDTFGPDQRAQIKRVLKEVESITVTANKATNDVASIVGHIKAGRGSVGALVMDEEIYDDLQELLRDVKHNPWKLFWRE